VPGNFRRNRLDTIELRGFRGLGGLGWVEAGSGPESGSGSSGPAFGPRSRRPADTGWVQVRRAGRTVDIAGSTDNRAVAPGRAECFAPGILGRVGCQSEQRCAPSQARRFLSGERPDVSKPSQ